MQSKELGSTANHTDMIPPLPSIKWLQRCEDKEAPEPLAVDEGPAREELGQVVCVTLFLREALGQAKSYAVIFGAQAVERNLARRDHTRFRELVVDAIGGYRFGAVR